MVQTAATLNNLNDDVLHEICSSVNALSTGLNRRQGHTPLKSLSLVNKHFREVSVPILFRNVRVIGPKGESRMILEGDWMTARTAIAELQNFLVRHIRNFKFDIYAARRPIQPPKREDFEHLVKFLVRMPHLRNLVLYVPLPHVPALESAFEAADIILPSVNTLVFNPLCVFIVNRCPNLEAASIHTPYHWDPQQPQGDPSDVIQKYKVTLVNALNSAKLLRRFEAKGPWCVGDLNALATVAPKLRWLEMRGTWNIHDADPTLEKLKALSRFAHLERLEIDDASELGLGFDPPWCGNAYMGPGGAELWKQVEEDRKKTEDVAAAAAFVNCASLKEVWIGELSKAQVVRGEDGKIDNIIWSRGEQETDSIAK